MTTHLNRVFLATGLLLVAVTMAASDEFILHADSESHYTLKLSGHAMTRLALPQLGSRSGPRIHIVRTSDGWQRVELAWDVQRETKVVFEDGLFRPMTFRHNAAMQK